MPDIVTPREVADYLRVSDDPETRRLASALAERVESYFRRLIGRENRPFALQDQAGRVELHDGTGSSELWLNYPVDVLTSVVLGYDVSNPVESLDVADQNVLRWVEGRRRLVRIGRSCFGVLGAPGYVTVTYDSLAEEIPPEMGLAVLRLTSAAWHAIGTENVTQETIGGFSQSFSGLSKSDGFWNEVVDLYREPVI